MKARLDRGTLVLLLAAGAKLALHAGTNGGYGFHRDELATLADARHLAWGYVAYPPFTPFVGRIALALFGASLSGFRFFAALAQCAAIVLAGLIARRLGGGPEAQWTTAAAVAIAPVSLAASSLFQYVTFDFLWVVAIASLVVRLVDGGDRKTWLALGAIIGLAALTKYTIAFFAAGLVAGTLTTPLRADLRTRWPWCGAAIAFVLALPNLAWQALHGFVSLEFLRHIHERDVRIGRTDGFLADQVTSTTHPFTVPLWLLGLGVLILAPRWRRYRILAFLSVTPFALFLIARGRGYYMGGAYPALLAVGAVELERLLARFGTLARRAAWTVVGGTLAAGSAVALAILPLAPPGSDAFHRNVARNDDLAEELGWPELADETARIYTALPAADRPHTGIYCGNYGEAGAIDLYGPARGLPAPISGINSFWYRGPGDPALRDFIVIGATRQRLEETCGAVELVGHASNPWGVRNEETQQHPDIFLCRDLHPSLRDLWPKLRSFG